MPNKLSLEELKIEYVGKVFNFLTVTDVIRDNTNRIRFVCRCQCGNIKCIDKNKVLRGDIKSCGCFNTVNKNNTVLELRREYLDKTFNWLKVVDVLLSDSDNSIKFKCVCKCGNIKYASLRDLKSGKLKSCGCYIKSKERAEKYKQLRKIILIK